MICQQNINCLLEKGDFVAKKSEIMTEMEAEISVTWTGLHLVRKLCAAEGL